MHGWQEYSEEFRDIAGRGRKNVSSHIPEGAITLLNQRPVSDDILPTPVIYFVVSYLLLGLSFHWLTRYLVHITYIHWLLFHTGCPIEFYKFKFQIIAQKRCRILKAVDNFGIMNTGVLKIIDNFYSKLIFLCKNWVKS